MLAQVRVFLKLLMLQWAYRLSLSFVLGLNLGKRLSINFGSIFTFVLQACAVDFLILISESLRIVSNYLYFNLENPSWVSKATLIRQFGLSNCWTLGRFPSFHLGAYSYCLEHVFRNWENSKPFNLQDLKRIFSHAQKNKLWAWKNCRFSNSITKGTLLMMGMIDRD